MFLRRNPSVLFALDVTLLRGRSYNPTVFDERIKMNGPYPEITNISFLAKLFFKTFISLKHFSYYRTVGLSDRRTIGLSDYRTVVQVLCYM
jgi:hypothetical protein